MSLSIIQPGSHTTPNGGGDLAVTGDTNTGHGSTTTSCSSQDVGPAAPDSDSQGKSCRWHSLPAGPGGNVIGKKLKFSWTVSGSVDNTVDTAGSGTASIQFLVEYSVDGGSNWTTRVSQSKSVSGTNVSDTLSASGSEEITLSNSQDVSQIQVRDSMTANTSATAPTTGVSTSSASVTTTVSGVQVEITIADPQVIVMM